jgi:hypothetical protein
MGGAFRLDENLQAVAGTQYRFVLNGNELLLALRPRYGAEREKELQVARPARALSVRRRCPHGAT